jgi:hypothetical protein
VVEHSLGKGEVESSILSRSTSLIPMKSLTLLNEAFRPRWPLIGPRGIARAGFWAMLGAADALSHAAVTGEIIARQAEDELFETIVAMVDRSTRR